MSRAKEAYKRTREKRAAEAARSNDVASMIQKLNELSKTNENLIDENNKKTTALKELEEAQAARLKAEELAKTQAEKYKG